MTNWVELAVENRERLRLPPLTASTEHSALAQSYFEFYKIDFESRIPGLKHHFGVFPSSGFDIAIHVFIPEGAQQTAFLYHGFYDHAGLFKHAIEYCLRRHYAVVVYDLPGHGLSTGRRAEIDSFDQYLSVLNDAFFAAASFELPKTKLAIAQSTGCAVLMSYMLNGGGAFDKAVLLAPLVRPGGWRWGKPLHSVIGNRVQSLPRRWAENSGDAEFLDWLRKLDVLQCNVLPMRWVNALKQWEPKFHKLPVSAKTILVVQGDADTTVDWKFNLPAIREHFPNAVVSNLSGARHHLVNETNELRERIWERVSAYLSS
ncbi:MAG: alpha-beta hydrolase superfamily lysophospholipase [Bermanella sp.]|jgi:alpha-beta hydrolase superfamily lysophospholipase